MHISKNLSRVTIVAIIASLPLAFAATMTPAVATRLGALRSDMEDLLYGKERLMSPPSCRHYPLSSAQFPPPNPVPGKVIFNYDVTGAVRRLIDHRNSIRIAVQEMRDLLDTGCSGIYRDMRLGKLNGNLDDTNMVNFYVQSFDAEISRLYKWADKPLGDLVKPDLYDKLFQWYDAMGEEMARETCEKSREMMEGYAEVDDSVQDPVQMRYVLDTIWNLGKELKYCEKFENQQ